MSTGMETTVSTLFAKVERQRKTVEADLEVLRTTFSSGDERAVLISRILTGLTSFQATLRTLEENAVQRETNMDKRALSKEQVDPLFKSVLTYQTDE
jgi:hypothetical protein